MGTFRFDWFVSVAKFGNKVMRWGISISNLGDHVFQYAIVKVREIEANE